MKRNVKIGVGVAAGAIVLGAAGIGVALAGPDNDQPVTGPAADKARSAAIQAIPGGTAGKVEKETNEGAAYYGVTVSKPDGTKVEVHEDQNFKVLGTEAPDNDD
jgi:hypothetical protein